MASVLVAGRPRQIDVDGAVQLEDGIIPGRPGARSVAIEGHAPIAGIGLDVGADGSGPPVGVGEHRVADLDRSRIVDQQHRAGEAKAIRR